MSDNPCIIYLGGSGISDNSRSFKYKNKASGRKYRTNISLHALKLYLRTGKISSNKMHCSHLCNLPLNQGTYLKGMPFYL